MEEITATKIHWLVLPPKGQSFEKAKPELNLVLPAQASCSCPLPSEELEKHTNFPAFSYRMKETCTWALKSFTREQMWKIPFGGLQPLSGRSFKSFLSFMLWFSYQSWGLGFWVWGEKRLIKMRLLLPTSCGVGSPSVPLKELSERSYDLCYNESCLRLFFPSHSNKQRTQPNQYLMVRPLLEILSLWLLQ
jgi:hypothetical protein